MLVATLAIPITEQKHGIGKILDMEGTLIDKHLTLSKLLGLDRPPTRDSLIEDFVRFLWCITQLFRAKIVSNFTKRYQCVIPHQTSRKAAWQRMVEVKCFHDSLDYFH